MQPSQLLRVLQVTDSFFPVGAFAYSDGLETAATNGAVRDAGTLGEWMLHYLDAVFVPCDGLALFQGLSAFRSGDHATLRRLDEELTAIRPAGSVRASSVGVGRRLLTASAAAAGPVPKTASTPSNTSLLPLNLASDGSDALLPLGPAALPHGNAPLAYAMVFARAGVSERDALLAFGYNRLAGMISVGLRLLPLGQQQGQSLLTAALGRLPSAVDAVLELRDEPLRSFSPRLDIQQMNHRYVYSRLFRS